MTTSGCFAKGEAWKHPARSPLVLSLIVALLALLGGIGGHFSHDYGPGVDETLMGVIGGGLVGVFVAIVWSLLVELADR